MENQLCLTCYTTECLRIKPINQYICTNIHDIYKVERREFDQTCDDIRRPDGCRIFLIDGREYETTIARRKITRILKNGGKPCKDCGNGRCLKIKAVFKDTCIFAEDVLDVQARPYDKEKQKRRLDGCCIILKNKKVIITLLTIKKVKKMIENKEKMTQKNENYGAPLNL